MLPYEGHQREVVITGIGVASPLGLSMREVLSFIEHDLVNFVPWALSPSIFVSPVNREFEEKLPSFKYKRYLSQAGKLILYSAKMALCDAGLDEKGMEKAALFVGVGPNTGVLLDEEELSPALALLKVIPNMTVYAISALYHIHGENLTISNACTSSLQAIGEGYRRIRRGEVEFALCGGGDSRLNPWGIRLYQKARVLLEHKGETPSRAYAPFDRHNRGFVPGEGAAFLVLEEKNRAINRGARIYGEIKGYGSSLDGLSPTAPDLRGRSLRMSLERALEDAGLMAGEIEVVFAHGTGTPLNDEVEIGVISSVFPQSCRVCALKSWIGHLSAGCGAVELCLALACLRDGFLPPIRNLKNPRGKLSFVMEREDTDFRRFIIENMGFGGHNASLVVEID